MRDFLFIAGLVCTLCALVVYHFVGAANPLYEATDSDRVWAATSFVIPALLLFYFAWRKHVKERRTGAEPLIINQDSGSADAANIERWLKQWKEIKHP